MLRGLEGKKTRLVPLDRERHIDNAVRWMNDPDVTTWLGARPGPYSRGMEEQYVATTREDRLIRWAIETLDGKHIGFSELNSIDWTARHATCGSLIGDAEDRGHGYGSDASRVRARFAFEELNLLRLYSGYQAGNEASGRMQAAVGFREWGRRPAAIFRRGEHHDVVEMVLTREDLRL
jgi:RimJ/RimL family protein N-acetyltransferase